MGCNISRTEIGIAIVVVHHTRKASADDPLDRVSGTTGLTGAADSVITMSRSRVLEVRGRDIEETEYKLKHENGRHTESAPISVVISSYLPSERLTLWRRRRGWLDVLGG